MRILSLFILAALILKGLSQTAETTTPQTKDARQIYADFEAIDANSDGYIDAGELRQAIAGITEDDITTLFDQYDAERDGVLTFEEYINLATASK